ncbi:MAG: cation transporter [Bacteroidales bacterium]|nr:cation transporter [Bacteroidales bacterium]MCF8391270.1 cation transporter [Bacteroidales bacterium]
MKKTIMLLGIFLVMGTTGLWAQNKTNSVKIQTSAQCEMCKTAIENAFAFEKGVVSSVLDMDTKIVTVEYKEKKTSPEQIRTSLSKIGYDADDVKADEKAYKKLPTCCKKPEDR